MSINLVAKMSQARSMPQDSLKDHQCRFLKWTNLKFVKDMSTTCKTLELTIPLKMKKLPS